MGTARGEILCKTKQARDVSCQTVRCTTSLQRPQFVFCYFSCETPEFQQKRITFRNAMAMTSSKDIVQLVVSRDHILEVDRHHVCPLLKKARYLWWCLLSHCRTIPDSCYSPNKLNMGAMYRGGALDRGTPVARRAHLCPLCGLLNCSAAECHCCLQVSSQEFENLNPQQLRVTRYFCSKGV